MILTTEKHKKKILNKNSHIHIRIRCRTTISWAKSETLSFSLGPTNLRRTILLSFRHHTWRKKNEEEKTPLKQSVIC